MRKLMVKIGVVCVVLALLISLSVFASPQTMQNGKSSLWNPTPPPDAALELAAWNPVPPPTLPIPDLAAWNPVPPPTLPIPD